MFVLIIINYFALLVYYYYYNFFLFLSIIIFIIQVPLSVCEMTNLNSLDLSYNPIIELRPELGKLSNIWDFPLDDLKLISPPHNIIERGKAKDIIGFLWSLLQRYNILSPF